MWARGPRVIAFWVTRAGIHGSFPTYPAFVERWRRNIHPPAAAGSNFERYAAEGAFEYLSPYVPGPQRYSATLARTDLGTASQTDLLQACEVAQTGDAAWLRHWRRGIARRVIAARIDLAVHVRAEREFTQGDRPQPRL